MRQSISQFIAERVTELQWGDLPEAVQANSKYRVLDLIGVTLAGWHREKVARVICDYVRDRGGVEEARIWGPDIRVPADAAALANGIAGHSLELDDDHNVMIGHPGVATIPAVIAVGEREGASGRRILEGVVAAYEVAIRVGRAVREDALLLKGFHPTGVVGVFGAAAGAAKVAGATPSQLVDAFGVCGSQSAGSIQATDEGVLTKRFNPGWAAHNGVLACDLALRGFTGPRFIFEGRHGWYNAYAGEGNYDLDKVVAGWGEDFEIVRTSWKPYACARPCHGAIDCVLDIRQEESFLLDEIEDIQIGTYREALPFVAEPRERKLAPETTVDAQFSIYYATAVALLTGRAYPDEFGEERLHDDQVLHLARRVSVSVDEELDALYPECYPARVTIRLSDGRLITRVAQTPRGDPKRPLSATELENRFRTLTAGVLDDGRCDEILEKVGALETMPDIRGLTQCLVGSSEGYGA